MTKITFIIHGKNRNSDVVIPGIRKTFTAPYQPIILVTEVHLHAVQLARQAVFSGSKYIIGVCGDGTFNEIINGVMESGVKDVCVGLMPNGTGNDFAKTMGVDSNPETLKQLIQANSIRVIDLGQVHYKNANGTDAQRYFNNITDVGIGGMIAEKVAGSSKMLGAFLTFQWAIVRSFISFKHQQAKIKADDFSYEGNIMSCIVANGKYFGAGLGVAPDAKVDDGIFHVVLGAEISLWDYLKALGDVRKCLRINHPEMKYLSAKEVMIETPQKRMPIDMDGEFIGYSPMRVSIVPQAVRFIGPDLKQ